MFIWTAGVARYFKECRRPPPPPAMVSCGRPPLGPSGGFSIVCATPRPPGEGKGGGEGGRALGRLGYSKCVDGWRLWRWMAAGLREGGVGSRTRASYHDLAEAKGRIGSDESGKFVHVVFRHACDVARYECGGGGGSRTHGVDIHWILRAVYLSQRGARRTDTQTQTPRRCHVCPVCFCVPCDDHTLTGLTPNSPRPRRDY